MFYITSAAAFGTIGVHTSDLCCVVPDVTYLVGGRAIFRGVDDFLVKTDGRKYNSFEASQYFCEQGLVVIAMLAVQLINCSKR